MPSLLTTISLAFGLGLLLTAAMRRLLGRVSGRGRAEARALGAAAPGPAAAPRMGGVAVMAAAGLALLLPGWLAWPLNTFGDAALLRQLAIPVLLVLAAGTADDAWNLVPGWKFAVQGVAGLWVIALGLRVKAILHHPLPLWASVVMTLIWLTGCSNAFNLIDGMDGLATGLALFATGTVLAHAVLIGEPALALVMGALTGALAAFLLFNFPPASMYLGDAGSLSIGFVLGCMALVWANKATTTIGLIAPLFALAVPMVDTGVAIVRRALTGQALFAGDQRHIHHRLLRRGLTPRRAVLLLYAVAGAGAAVSLLLADVRQRQTYELVILLFVALAVVGVQQLRYAEFSEVGRLLRRGRLDPRKTLHTQVALRHWAQEIGRAQDYEQLWECLRQAGRALEFHAVEFRAGRAEAPRWQRREQISMTPATAEACGWRLEVPLGENGGLGAVEFWRGLSPEQPGIIDDVAATLGAALAQRLPGMAGAAARATGAGS
jgi:UDP-GlcNAc:undecaprenyl-phosphate GlcNAc-1-phosphate transferase